MEPRQLGAILLGLVRLFRAVPADEPAGDYRLLLNLATLLLILYAGACNGRNAHRYWRLLAWSGCFCWPVWQWARQGFIGTVRRVDLFHALLTPAYPLLAWLLLHLPGSAKPAARRKPGKDFVRTPLLIS